MVKLQRVLFPIDFSPPCVVAAPWVKSLVTQSGSQLTLIHSIVVPPTWRFASSDRVYAQVRKELRQKSDLSMRRFIDRHFKSVAVQHVIEEGDPAQHIVDRARKDHADLIMMPTRGYGPFRRFLTGSVTAKVLHDAPCAVWTSTHATKSQAGNTRNMLCAIDLGEGTSTLMRWASDLASKWGANLAFVYVNPAINETSQNRGEKAVRKYLIGEAQETFARHTKEVGLSLPLLIRGGDVAKRLAATVRQRKADLLVVGRGHVRKRLGRLRAHSLAIVCESPCPVISV